MKPCDIRDLFNLSDIVSNYLKRDCTFYVREKMQNGSKWFIKEGLAVIFQSIGERKYTIHLYGKPLRSIKELISWLYECYEWMSENTNMEVLLVFCDKEDRRLSLVLSHSPAKKICTVNYGDREEALYQYGGL